MPWPFSRGVFIYGEPLFVEKNASPEEIELARRALEDRLVELTQRADEYFEGR